MNKVILIGRLTKDPQVYYGNLGEITVARYTLAVKRKFYRERETSVDFIDCVTFRRKAEFTKKYLKKGKKIVVVGRIQTGSYMNNNGRKIYTSEIVVDEIEFAERKKYKDVRVDVDENGYLIIPDSFDTDIQ